MTSAYPLVPLGEVLSLSRDEVVVEAAERYRIAGMYSFGRGLFERQSVTGTETQYRSLFRLHEGDLVVSRLNGWEGAIAVVDKAHDRCFVSNEYPTFSIDPKRVHRSYLEHLCVWPEVWSLLRQRAKGMGSDVGARRLRVHPEHVFSVEVPLPSLDEQQRIADLLDEALSSWDSVTSTAKQFRVRAHALKAGYLRREIQRLSTSVRPLGEVAQVWRGRGPKYDLGSGQLAVNQACVRERGVDLTACREVSSQWWDEVPAELRVQGGDVLVNSTGEGTIGRSTAATQSAEGLPFDSHVLAVRADTHFLRPDFLAAFLQSPEGQDAIELSKSANTTKQTELGKRKLELLDVPVPTLAEQDSFVSQLREVDTHLDAVEIASVKRDGIVAAFPTALRTRAFSGLV